MGLGGQKSKKATKRDEEDDEAEDELENVFAQANDNNEMDLVENLRQKADSKDEAFVNNDLVSKIEKIEDEMMNPKSWQLIGEAKANERPMNSLLDVHLDFNAATKLPPTITKETTNKLEDLVKQRVLDELFDDPVLKNEKLRRKLGEEEEMDFTKSKKGLGDLYADDIAKKLASSNPEAFLEGELAGPDAPLKRECEDIAAELFNNLDSLANFHYTPKVAKTESQITTQNVPSLQLEEAIPIGVSKGSSKTAREIFSVNALALREKTELTKEEKRKERVARKRKIKQSMKAKAEYKKEHLRQQGLALAEKFLVKDAQRQMDKMNKKKGKKGKGSAAVDPADEIAKSRRTNSSA